MKKLLIFAFLLRIIIAPLAEHGDVVQYYWWAQDLWNRGFLFFYDREIVNAMRPTYPPVTSYLFYLTGALHALLWQIIWFLNQSISFFPSNLIFWWESQRGWFLINKLPAILADMGIIIVLIKFGEEFSKKYKLIPSFLFAFLPPFFYSSAVWGQTDSIYAFFLISSFYATHKNKLTLGALLFTLSFLTKPAPLFVLSVFIIWWLKKSNTRITIKSLALSLVLLLTLYFPFHPDNLIIWMITFYSHSLGGELDYIVANSFNLWGLIFGFNNVSEKTLVLGIPAFILGNALFLISLFSLLTYSYFKTKAFLKTEPVLLLSSIISFSAFIFLPRMHERYFYPTLLLLLPLVVLDKKIRNVFISLSLIHLINLYHFFWVPKIDILIILFSNPLIEKILITLNIFLFLHLIRVYVRMVKIKEVKTNGQKSK